MKKHIQSPLVSSTYSGNPSALWFGAFWILAALDVMLIRHFTETLGECLVVLTLFVINVYYFLTAAVRIRGGCDE